MIISWTINLTFCAQYTDWEHQVRSDQSIRDNIYDLLTDALYTAPIIDVALLHANSPASNTYLYYFNHSSAAGSLPASFQADPAARRRQWQQQDDQMTSQYDDLVYMFGVPITDGVDPYDNAVYTRADKQASETVLKYWTNFIKTGSVMY